jgi:hypothetical protein
LGKSALIVSTKVEASVALDLLTQPDLLAKIKKEHAALKGK